MCCVSRILKLILDYIYIHMKRDFSTQNEAHNKSEKQCPIFKKGVRIDFKSREFNAKLYEYLKELRKESPVHRVLLEDDFPVWLITRYADAKAILQDERAVKSLSRHQSEEGGRSHAYLLRRMHMLAKDPPDHTRLRQLVHKAFTPKLIEKMRGRIQEVTDELLNKMQSGHMVDLIADFAVPLPITIIADLLGVPQTERHRLKEWAGILIDAHITNENRALIENKSRQFTDYLKFVFEEHRLNPRGDIISALLSVSEQEDRLSEEELYAMVFLLLVAGFETTVNLIGNGIYELLRHPDQLELLKKSSALIHKAVDEILRYNTSVHVATMRIAKEDIVLGDNTIPKGEGVLVMLSSANHDEQKFEASETFDITRSMNSHLSFGYGIHYCLGAPLAKLELEIAIATLFNRMPNIRLAVDEQDIVWNANMMVRGLKTLPVVY